MVKTVTDFMLENKVVFDKKETVNHMTLASKAKEIFETGEGLPPEDVAIFKPKQVLKITVKK